MCQAGWPNFLIQLACAADIDTDAAKQHQRRRLVGLSVRQETLAAINRVRFNYDHFLGLISQMENISRTIQQRRSVPRRGDVVLGQAGRAIGHYFYGQMAKYGREYVDHFWEGLDNYNKKPSTVHGNAILAVVTSLFGWIDEAERFIRDYMEANINVPVPAD